MNWIAFIVGIVALIAIYATLVLALDLQFSYGNLINLGIVAYVAVGAYAYSIVTQEPPGPFDDYQYGFGLPIPVGLLAAGGAGLLFGALTGWPSLRLRGEYLALMTFAFAEVFDTFLINAKFVTNGLVGLPSVVRPFENLDPDVQTWSFAGLCVVLAILAFLLVRRIVKSPYGRLVLAVSDDEQGAAAVGKDIGIVRVQIFLIGAVLMSLAGAFFVMYVSLAVPTIFIPEVTFTVWIALVLGGIRTRFGAIIGAVLLIGMQEGLRLLSLSPDQSAFVSSLRLFLTGLLLVVLLRLRPPEHLIRTPTRPEAVEKEPGASEGVDGSVNAEAVEVRDVEVVFGGLRALKGVSVDAQPGGITGLIGPNGAGKTTLFNVITSMIRPQRGQVRVGGNDITNTPPHKIARQGVARTFQTPRGFPSLSVIDNVLIGVGDSKEHLVPSLLGGKFTAGLRERQTSMLERVGLSAKAGDSYKNLSSGEARLLEVARHLIRQPQYLLLDEPTAGVAPELQHRLSDLLRQIRDDGTTLICVEHNMKFLRGLADHVVVLDLGEIICSGDPDSVFADQRVIDAYLGQGRSESAAD